jgi:hypothetical protein
MKPVATVMLLDNRFVIKITDRQIADQKCCIYAFLLGDEIVRIGSSKGAFRKRMRKWELDVSKALAGRKSDTRLAEAKEWKRLLQQHRAGRVFARQGTIVETPIGRISTYLDEESTLIGLHLPLLNHSKHR